MFCTCHGRDHSRCTQELRNRQTCWRFSTAGVWLRFLAWTLLRPVQSNKIGRPNHELLRFFTDKIAVNLSTIALGTASTANAPSVRWSVSQASCFDAMRRVSYGGRQRVRLDNERHSEDDFALCCAMQKVGGLKPQRTVAT
eukprot:3293538-Amphidinium_carterae.2